MLVEVGKFTFPVDFVILEIEEDSKVPLVLGRPFLHTADAVIRVKQKQLNLRVGSERMVFSIDSAMKHSYSNDDTCFSIDVIDEILEEDFDALLDEGSKILYSIEGTPLEDKIFVEFNEFIAINIDENTESMRMEQYLTYTNYALWEVIVNGYAPAIASASTEVSCAIKDAKTLWEAIKTRFRGNKESKKMQKTILKQQYENFNASRSEGLDKTYDRIHSSTNEAVNTTHEVSTANSQGQASSSSYANDVMFSFFVKLFLDISIVGHMSLHIRVTAILKEGQEDNLTLMAKEAVGFDKTHSQICVNNKTSIGFDSQMTENELHDIHKNNSKVFESASDGSVNEIEKENNQVNDRFKKVEGYHAVPPPYTGNYMPSRLGFSFAGLDDSNYKTNVSETITSVPRNESTASKSNKDNLEQPKDVRLSTPIVEKYKSDSDDDCVTRPSIEQNKPSYAKFNFVKSNENTRKSVNNVTTAGPKAVVSAAEGNGENAVKSSACWIWRPTGNVIDHISKDSGSYMLKRFDYGNPQYTLQDQGIFDSGCSRHMTGNKSFLTDYQEIDGGFVAFGGSPKGGKITGKGKIRTGKLDFEDVYFVKELKFNLFSVSQMCDKKNSVLFTETECLILSPDFKLLDESQVLLKVPRQDNMYSFDLKNVVPLGGLTCLIAKAIIDESNLWHRRLGHINFKTMNKLVRGNLVRGLPSKLFENDHILCCLLEGKAIQSLL
ncbi:ribonuclease H-like domain-containing protein [Tanacetum coccineum]